MNFNDKNVLIIGAGISGIAAVRLLEEAGAVCTLFDGNEKLDCNRVRENFPENSNLQIHAGELPQEVLAKADLLVMSPGVPTDIAIVEQAKEMGISFIVLAGGEPMLREDVILKASKYPEILFPIFRVHKFLFLLSF